MASALSVDMEQESSSLPLQGQEIGAHVNQKSPSSPSRKEEEEPSLTTILTLSQRTQLIILLATITSIMRENLLLTFSADSSPSLKREDDKILNPNIDPGSVDVQAFDRERKIIAAREKELSEDRMRELKTAVEEWFDRWRGAVIGRVGEVLRRKKDAKDALDERQSNKTDVTQGSDSKIQGEPETMLDQLHSPVETPLVELAETKRILILHSMLLILLSLEHYAAPSRTLLLYLVRSLKLQISVLDEDEKKTAQGLLQSTKELDAKPEAEKHAMANEQTKKWKIGLATVAGAALVGITGGMAAPLVAAGVGSVMGGLGLGATAAAGYLGSVAGSTLVVGGLFGAYGGRMTGRMMENYAKEVSDFAFIPVHNPERLLSPTKSEEDTGKDSATSRRLRVTIGITGWLTDAEEVVNPWRVLGNETEVFALQWELESLLNLGNAISAMVSSTAWGYAKKQIIARTIFADMMAALWPLGVLQLGRLVDNPFSIAKVRAEKAGAVLADALINKAQGERPVTLIGYSLGARVIHSCLMTLAARKQFGLVDTVVLLGAPIPSNGRDWRAMRSVVSGRLVNVFSRNDYVLGFLYRTSSIQFGVAGLQQVQGVHGVENVDMSETVSGHLKYRYLIGAILKKIGFQDLNIDAIKKEEEAFRKIEEEERKRAEEIKKKLPSNIPGKSYVKDSGEKSGQVDENQKQDEEAVQNAAKKEAEDLQKDVQAKTQKSLMERGMEYLSFNKGSKKEEKSTSSQTSQSKAFASSASQDKEEPESKDESADSKSYLEMASQGGASVSSAAANLFSGAKTRLSWGASSASKTGTVSSSTGGGQSVKEEESRALQ